MSDIKIEFPQMMYIILCYLMLCGICNQDSYNATSCDFLGISVVQFVMYLIGLKGQTNFPFLSKTKKRGWDIA